METVILIFSGIFHTVNKCLLNIKTFFIQSLLHLFRKIKHCAKFNFSACNECCPLMNTTKFGFS